MKRDVLRKRLDGDVGRPDLQARLLDLAVEDVDVALEGHPFALEAGNDGIGLAYLGFDLIQLPLELRAALARSHLGVRENGSREHYKKNDGTERNEHQKRVPTSK